MSSANPLNATFFAFRKRERGGVLSQLAFAFVLFAVLLWGAFFALFAGSIANMFTAFVEMVQMGEAGAEPSPEQVQSMLGMFGMFAALIPFLFFYYVLTAAFEAGCYRWMVRGEVKGLMGLSLDADTWRVYSVYWVNFGVQFAIGLVFGLIAVILVLITGGDLANAEQSTVANLVDLIQNIILYYIIIRLAPAAAVSVVRRQFSYAQAWTVTRDRFWAMFGAYLLIWLFLFAAIVVLAVIGFFSLLGSQFQALSGLSGNADPEAFISILSGVFTSPTAWIIVGILGIFYTAISTFGYVLIYGVNARAAIAGVEDGKIDGMIQEVAKTFD